MKASARGEARPREFRGEGGLRLVADVWGDPVAPPVLLLHGGGQTRHSWGGTAEALAADGWYAVAIDLRGHGDSEWASDGDYSFDGFVADLHAVLADLGRKPVLVGASLGGITSLLAEGEPEEPVAEALVLVDVVPSLDRQGVARILAFMSDRPDGFASLDEAADAIAEHLPHRPRPTDLSGLRKNLRLHGDGRYRWHWDPRFLTGERRPAATRDPDRLRAAARAVRAPTLLVRGRKSELVTVEGVREFLALVPHARFVDVAEAGHMVAGDRNDAFTEAVRGFLAERRRGAPRDG
jgi:non-heme chloroperoxidase